MPSLIYSADHLRKGKDNDLLCRLSQFFQVKIKTWALGWKKAESLQDGILAWVISSLFVSLSGTGIPVSFVAFASQP